MNIEQLEKQVPWIEWREPLKVTVPGGGKGLLCRICTAQKGFKAEDVNKLPQTQEEFDKHMEEEHPNATSN